MSQPMNPPRILIRPANNLQALSGLLFSFYSCCADPTPGITRYHSDNPDRTGWTIYCESCDTTLASMTWNPEDMREYSNQENTRKADEAAAENVTLHFPGFPPIQGVGPVITEIRADDENVTEES